MIETLLVALAHRAARADTASGHGRPIAREATVMITRYLVA
jgi:hypothetical protein